MNELNIYFKETCEKDYRDTLNKLYYMVFKADIQDIIIEKPKQPMISFLNSGINNTIVGSYIGP